MIVVTGDPLRTNAYVFAHNGRLGYPVAKKIDLPAAWDVNRGTAMPESDQGQKTKDKR
jgi:hypothetical protein